MAPPLFVLSIDHYESFEQIWMRVEDGKPFRFWIRGYCLRYEGQCWHDGAGYNLEEALLRLRDDFLKVHQEAR